MSGWDIKQTVASSKPFTIYYGDIEKAIEDLMHLQSCTSLNSNCFKERHGESLRIAILALEKQLSDKPYYLNYGGVGNWNHGLACICDYEANYCKTCGKKLDWSDER